MATRPARESLRRRGGATYRLIRYADDFVVCVAGRQEHALALRSEVEQVLAPLGLRLSPEKTRVVSIDDGFDFLGFAIKRVRGRHGRIVIHTYPSKRALQSVKAKVRQITKCTGPDQAPDRLIQRVNRVLRGWRSYFRHGVSSATVGYLRHFADWRVVAGCAADTESGTGAGCAAPTSRNGGPPTKAGNSSTQWASASADTATAARRSRFPGQPATSPCAITLQPWTTWKD